MGGDNVESLERQPGKRRQKAKSVSSFLNRRRNRNSGRRRFICRNNDITGQSSNYKIWTQQCWRAGNADRLFYCGKRNGRQRQTLGLEYTIDRQASMRSAMTA